jgi:hypothetical protein
LVFLEKDIKMKRKTNLEQGQITVLFLFAVVALFGFAALSIDGGRLYFQRRAAQSTADDAAMTGALAIANGYDSTQVQGIVLNRTKSNGFDNAEDGMLVEVHWPPVAPNPYAGDINYIQVFITSQIPTYFAQFVYRGDLQVTAEAVARVHPPTGIIPGYAIYGANDNACKTVRFNGNPIVEVSGGGSIGSNSSAMCDCVVDPVTGAPLGGSMVKEGTINVSVVDGGQITAAGCWGSYGASGSITPAPIPNSQQMDIERLQNKVPIPDCSGQPDFGKVTFNGPGTMSPGYYSSLKFNASADVTLAPGLYCIYGSDPWSVEMQGGARVVGHGVTFYMMTTTGGWKGNGGAYVELTAPPPDALVDPSDNDWAGMLLYAHPSNTYDVTLSGTSNSYYEGSIYALGSHCNIEGTSGNVAFKTNVYCDTVEVGGTGDLDIFYDEGKNYQIPAALDLSK